MAYLQPELSLHAILTLSHMSIQRGMAACLFTPGICVVLQVAMHCWWAWAAAAGRA